MPWLTDELRELDADEKRRKRRRKARDKATPDVVRRVRDMQASWPTLPARTKLLLADSGITADSPVTREIAQLGVKVLAREKDRIRLATRQARGKEATVGLGAQEQARASEAERAALLSGEQPITNKRQAKTVLAGTEPLSFEQVEQIWENYDEMSGDERERLRDRLAGIDPSEREARASDAGRALQDQPRTKKEEHRLAVLRQYEGDLRRGDLPQAKNEKDQQILDEMRTHLAGVDVEAVERRIAAHETLGAPFPGGTPLKPEEQADIQAYLDKEKAAKTFDVGAAAFKGVLRTAGVAALAPGELVTSQFRQGVQRVRDIAGGDAPLLDMGTEGGGLADVTGLQSSVGATTAGQMGEALFEGRDVDVGGGFFPDPDSPVGKAQAEAAREEGELYGQAITPGRLAARGIVATGLINPKDNWYNVASGVVDAAWAVSQIGDPTNLILDTYTAGRRAGRLYDIAAAPADEALKRGVVKTGRGAMSPKTFDETITGAEAARLINGLWAAKQAGDFRYLRQTVKDAGVAVRILDAEAKDQIPDILRGATGLKPIEKPPLVIPAVTGRETEVLPGGGFASPAELVTPKAEEVIPVKAPEFDPVLVEQPKLPGVTYHLRKPLDDVRLFHDMPRGAIDSHDVNRGTETFEAVLRNGKVAAGEREDILAQFAREVTQGGRPAIMAEGGAIRRGYGAIVESEVDRFARSIRGRIGGEEAVEEFRRGAVARHGRAFLDSYEDTRRYMLDEFGNNAKLPWVMANGTREPVAEPARFVEFLQRAIPIPDTREVRKATSWMAPAYQTPGVKQFLEGSTTALDFFYTQAFKPLALITRIAYPVRVIGEEQFRMAGAGYDSMVSGHLLSYLARVVGITGKGEKTADDFVRASAQAVMGGSPDEFAQAMSRGSGVVRLLDDPGDIASGIRLKDRLAYRVGEDRYPLSWAEELLKDHNEPVVRGIARFNPADAKDAFWNGELASLRVSMIRNGGGWDNLAKREWSDRYVDFLYDHIKTITRNDPDLLGAIVTGKIGDVPLVKIGKLGRGVGKPRINPKATRLLEERIRVVDGAPTGNVPPRVPGDRVMRVSRREQTVAAYDNAVQAMFTGLMGFPTDKLSRSQVFKQAHWNRVADLLPFANDEKVVNQWLRKAERMNLDRRALDKVKNAAARQTGEGRLTFAQIDTLAKSHGLDETRDLLYDLAKRNQFFDVMRFVFPFGDAFKELVTTWARLFRENPKAYYRFEQGIMAGRETGFFHENEYGQEVFTYPGTEMLTEKLVGVPVPLEGPIANLNLIGQGYPGVGPAVQWAAIWGLPNKPVFDVLEGFIFPYGRPENRDPVSLITEAVTPAWIEKITAAWGSPLGQELVNKTTARIATTLRSSGEYGESREEHARLMKDARAAADRFLIVQGLAQGVLPATPVPEHQVYDRDGKLLVMSKVAQEYHNRQAKDGQEAAIDWLVKTYGKDIYPVMAGLSSDLVFGLVDEKKAYDWERNNSGFMGKYPNIGGFFAPRGKDPDEAFDLSVYSARQDQGQSIVPDADVTMRVANDIFARWLYDKETEWAGSNPTEEQEDYLRDYKAYLRNAYPGFESDIGKVGKANVDERIEELRLAAEDPAVAGSPAKKIVTQYLRERDWVTKEAKERNNVTNWWSAKSTRDLVEYLGEYQTFLRNKYGRPANDVLDQVFYRDVAGLEEEE